MICPTMALPAMRCPIRGTVICPAWTASPPGMRCPDASHTCILASIETGFTGGEGQGEAGEKARQKGL